MAGKFNIFEDEELENKLSKNKADISRFLKSEVDLGKEETILEEGKEKFMKHFCDKYSINIPTIDYEKIYYNVEITDGVDYYVFKIPFHGREDYFQLRPVMEHLLKLQEVYIINQELYFEIRDDNYSSQKIKEKYTNIVEFIKVQATNLNKEIDDYNSSLKLFIEQQFTMLSNKKSNRSKKMQELGLPTKKPN